MGLFGKKTDEQIKAENKIEELCGGFLGNDRFKNKLEKNNLDESTSNTYYKSILKNEIKNKTLNYEGIESRLDELMKLDVDVLNNNIRYKQDTSLFKTQQDINDFMGDKYTKKYYESIEKSKEKNIRKERKRTEKEKQKQQKEEEKHIKKLEKEKSKIKKLEEKFNINLTGKKWFICNIEEIRYTTFTNEPVQNFDTAYVIINEDNFLILKESVWIKSNMGTRKLYFYNITSIDYDARGMFHASSSVIINTKSAEHVQLKFVTRDDFDLMNNAFESYLDKTHKPQQIAPIQQYISTVSFADELVKCSELYEKGLLTKEEFDLKKSELLSNKTIISKPPEYISEIPSEVEQKNKFCSNCGSEVEIDGKFCSNCGSKI